MAKRDTILIRAKKEFVEEILDEILKREKVRGAGNGGYPEATEILRINVKKLGGVKSA